MRIKNAVLFLGAILFFSGCMAVVDPNGRVVGVVPPPVVVNAEPPLGTDPFYFYPNRGYYYGGRFHRSPPPRRYYDYDTRRHSY